MQVELSTTPREPRADLPRPIPARMLARPVSAKGYPVPYFVAKVDGEWDFRIVDPPKLVACVKQRLCWLCGAPLGKFFAFVIGPMCGVTRISSEPPSHVDCAMWAAQACPFLTRPRAKRREANLPEQIVSPAGAAILRNPGVALVWVTRSYAIVKVDNGDLVQIGPPDRVAWFAEGREATRAEVTESIETGLPYLYAADGHDPQACRAIDERRREFDALLPAA